MAFGPKSLDFRALGEGLREYFHKGLGIWECGGLGFSGDVYVGSNSGLLASYGGNLRLNLRFTKLNIPKPKIP